MAENINRWLPKGLISDNSNHFRTMEEAEEYIEKIGFLPLFSNEIPGFSMEEHTLIRDWWSGDPKKDPWVWRELIAREHKIVYGKFFHRKAGFISLKWFPQFANYRRDGYDFDSLWDDEKISLRHKKIMDQFESGDCSELYSNDLKIRAGYGKNGEKNFDGVLTDLQMSTYLCVTDFRQRTNKKGDYYGWPIALYSKPEDIWGYPVITSAYKEKPNESHQKILKQLMEQYPDEINSQSIEKITRKVF